MRKAKVLTLFVSIYLIDEAIVRSDRGRQYFRVSWIGQLDRDSFLTIRAVVMVSWTLAQRDIMLDTSLPFVFNRVGLVEQEPLRAPLEVDGASITTIARFLCVFLPACIVRVD